jgi:hypothetical protein
MKRFKVGKMYRVKRKHWGEFDFLRDYWNGKQKEFVFKVLYVDNYDGSAYGWNSRLIASGFERDYCKRIRKAKKRPNRKQNSEVVSHANPSC